MKFKRYITRISAIAVSVLITSTHFAHAEGFFDMAMTTVLKIIAYVAYVIFSLAAWFLAVCGTLLNIGMQLTTHLDVFIHHTPIIYTVWETIRDLCSIMLIFFILWAAIQMIIGLKQAQYGALIKNIIIAGILINFSFFFTQILIDASNIVSLQFFNAMAPQQDIKYEANDSIGTVVSKTIKNGSGGISGVFSSSLKVNQWWNNKNEFSVASGASGQAITGIIISNLSGAAVQIMAGLSFLVVALATLWRTVMLIFLIGFSAVWIAAYAVPQLEEFKKEWMGQFKASLLFLPIYLAFMYVAVTIISKSNLSDIVGTGTFSTTGETPTTMYLQLFITFAIIIFMINIPLVVAVKVTGSSMGWTEKMFKGMKSKVTGWTKSGVKYGAKTSWMNTGGRAASAISRSEGLQDFASKYKVGELALKGIRGTASDYNKKLDAQVKARTDFASSLGVNKRQLSQDQAVLRSFQAQLASAKARGSSSSVIDHLKEQIVAAKAKVAQTENARKVNYANRIDRDSYGSLDTMWTKVARKDKVAAAKIHNEVLKKRLEVENKNLESIRSDIKEAKGSLDRLKNKIIDSGGYENPEQTAKKTELTNKINSLATKESDAVVEVNSVEQSLQKYENIS